MKKIIMSIYMVLAISNVQAGSWSSLSRSAIETCRKCYSRMVPGATRFMTTQTAKQIPAMGTKAKVVAGGLVGGSLAYSLKPNIQVAAEEEERKHVDIFPKNKDIFSISDGPVIPFGSYKEPEIEKPVNQPNDYLLSQFIPKLSAGRARLLNHTYSSGQMVVDDTGDEYHVFIKNPNNFFSLYEPGDLRFYVYKEGTGVAVTGTSGEGSCCVNAGIEFPVPLAKEILSTTEKPNYITPISHPDGTLEFVLKKDTSYNDSIFNKVWNLWGYWNKDGVSYWASDRPRDPRKPLSGPTSLRDFL